MKSLNRKPKGYWENFENVKHEVMPLITKLGRFPSNNEMTKAGMSSLARFIGKYHGGIIAVAKKLNIQSYDEFIGRNSKNTWNKENVTKLFKEYIKNKKIDYYPSRYDFDNEGSGLYIGITQVFGSYESFKKHLTSIGVTLKKKPKDQKWTYESAIIALQPIVAKLGHFPSQSDLDKLNYKGLRGYISKNNLLDSLKLKLGVSSKIRKNTVSRQSGYWSNTNNILNELNTVYKTYGRIPTGKEMLELGYGGLSIHLKKLPREVLEKYNYYSKSILIKTKDGHYVRSNYELLFDNYLSYNNIQHSTEGQITNTNDNKYQFDFKLNLNSNTIYVEIWGYTRGRNELEIKYHEKRLKKENIYRSLKLDLIGIQADIFDKPFSEIYEYFTNCISAFDINYKAKPLDLNQLLWGSIYNENSLTETLQNIIKDNKGYFPTTGQLRKIKNGDGLVSQIQKFGGVQYFKNKLKVDSKAYESKWSIEFLKNELNVINGLKYLPSYNELEALNRIDIFGGIQKHGGFKKVAKLLNIPTRNKYLKTLPKISKSKWTKEHLIKELNPIFLKYGKIPSEIKLIAIGRGDISFGIKKNGGFKKIKSLFEKRDKTTRHNSK